MAASSSAGKGGAKGDDGSDYRLLDELDRLEELLEELDELGLTTRDEVEARIASLEAQVGDLEPDPSAMPDRG